MLDILQDSTIVSLATPQEEGAISIIRLSGKNAIDIVDKIYKGKTKLKKVPTHTINYGYIYDLSQKKVDEVLVSVFKSPRSYTKEDVVEINTHGGVYISNKILSLLLTCGAKEASPGEFTQRAFLNGRIDLTQAEAVFDLIKAKNDKMLDLSLGALKGNLSKQIKIIQDMLIKIIGQLEVNIDYPEYTDIEKVNKNTLMFKIKEILQKISLLLQTKDIGIMLKDGIKIALVGKPNVGKSSILNCLLQEEKAIVTSIAGTTRDIVEGQVNSRGIYFKLLDTAGIQKSNDLVEEIGIKKSLQIIDDSQILLFVIDIAKITQDDINLAKKINKEKTLLLINKIDCKNKIDKLPEEFKKFKNLFISAKENINIEKIIPEVEKILNIDKLDANEIHLTNIRHVKLLNDAKENLQNATESLKEDLELDLITIDLKCAYDNLAKIIGTVFTDDLLENIFSNFCLGK